MKSIGPSAYLIQADFFYLYGQNYLALSEAMTGLIGCVQCGANVDRTISHTRHFFSDLGLMNPTADSIPAEVVSDAEDAVGSLLKRLPVRLAVKKAAPQRHQTIGRVERTVRRYKEMFHCVTCDLAEQGQQLRSENAEAVYQVLQYVAQTHNHVGTGAAEQGGSRRSLLELCARKDLPRIQTTGFGAVVHAQVTDSVRDRVASGSRFVLASYRYPEFGSLGHVVVAQGIDGEPVRFVTAIRPLNKLCWDSKLSDDVLKSEAKSDSSVLPIAPDADVDILIDEKIAWVKEHGPTEHCAACNSSARHGKVHSVACRKRYADWIRKERERMDNMPSLSSGDVLPGQDVSQVQLSPSPTSRHAPGPMPSVHDPAHPTQGTRFDGKQPPLQPPMEPASGNDDFSMVRDIDMNGGDSEYTPSIAGDAPMEIW